MLDILTSKKVKPLKYTHAALIFFFLISNFNNITAVLLTFYFTIPVLLFTRITRAI